MIPTLQIGGACRPIKGAAFGGTYDSIVLASNPLVYFKFDETSGGDLSTIADSSGNGRDCIIDFSSATADIANITLAPVAGKAGFGRGHDYTAALTGGGTVNVRDTTPDTALRMTAGGVSFEWLWVRSTGLRWIVFNGLSNGSANCYFELRQSSGSGAVEFKGSGATVWSSLNHGISDTTDLHHCVLTISSARSGTNSVNLYVDGTLVTSANPSSAFTQAGTGETLHIGERPDQAARTKLHGLAIYNTELTSTQVSDRWAARNT